MRLRLVLCVSFGVVAFTIETQQSCSLFVLPAYELDGEGFITISGENHRVRNESMGHRTRHGVVAAMDYEGAVTANDFAHMSEITSPSGIAFNALNLPWAPASTVALDCVRDVPPPLH